MKVVRSLVWIALAVAAASPWLHEAVAQTGPTAQTPSGTSELAFTPLTTRWAFPNPDAVNAGTVTIITCGHGARPRREGQAAHSADPGQGTGPERHRHLLS